MTKGITLIIGLTVLLLFLFTSFLNDVTTGLYGIIGLTVGIIGLIAMIINPFLGILLIIILNQFDNLINLPISTTAGRLIGVLVAIGWFLKYFYRKKTNFFNFIELNKFVLIFIISMIASSLLASYAGISLKTAFTITLLILMVFFLQDFINSKKNLNLFMMILALSVGLGSLVGIIQYKALIAGNMTMGTVAYEGTEQIARSAGLTLNPNAYGIILMSGIPLLLFLTNNASSSLFRRVSAFFFFTSVISLFITLSRTSIIGFVLFICIYFFLNFKYKNISKKQLVSLIIILIILLLVFFSFLFNVVQQRSFSFEHMRDEARYYILLKGVKLLSEHPLFGIGFGNFALLDRFDDQYGFIYGRGGHDIISDFFVSVGLFGTFLFIILCYKTLKYFNLSIKHFIKHNDKYLSNLAITLKSAFTALLFTCFGDSLIFQRIFWIYIALAIVMYSWSKLQFRMVEEYQQIPVPSYLRNH